MIRTENLSFSYVGNNSSWGLQDVCLDVAQGECIVICGASGCGKTTLTKALNGLIPHFERGWRAGRVLLNTGSAARDMKDIKPYELARIIGSVFQDPRSQFFTTRVADEIVWGCENIGVPKEQMKARLVKALSLFNLDAQQDRNVFELSNGEKQRAVFGSVWAMAPRIYILDEPSSNLDPGAVQHLARMIKALKSQGHTIVIAEHRLYYLSDLVDKMIIMDGGRIKSCHGRRDIQKFSSLELERSGLRQMDLTRHRFASSKRSTASGPCLVLENVSFRYGKISPPVIKNVNLEIAGGEILGLCGPNGSGKTTLSRLVSGLIKETAGTICLEKTVLSSKERLAICHLVLQQADHQLFRASVRQELETMPKKEKQMFRIWNRSLKQWGLPT